jgi:hypothetical protein
MSDLPKHIVVTLVIAVMIALAGGGGWYWTDSQLSTALSEKQSLQGRMNSLARGVYYPNAQNVKTLEDSVSALEMNIQPLEEKMRAASSYLDPVRGEQNAEGQYSGLSGDAWQKLLSGNRQELIQLAAESETQLPENFYLGFQRYRSLVPNDSVTLPLGIELAAISDISRTLITSGAKEIRSIKRVIVEDGASGGAGSSGANILGAKVVDAASGNYRLYPLEFRFTCTPMTLYQIVNRMTGADLFYIIRFIDVQNEKTTIPSQSEVISTASDTVANIVPILGQEMIQVRMRVDLVDWIAGEGKEEASTEKKS